MPLYGRARAARRVGDLRREEAPMRRVLVLAAASAALTVAVPAVAITEAELDGNGHASVGALIGHPPGGGLDIACSGFLVRPRVLVTAGHCTYGLAKEPEAPFVTFDPVFDPAPGNLFRASRPGGGPVPPGGPRASARLRHGHLVAVEVGVERGADERVNPDRLAFRVTLP